MAQVIGMEWPNSLIDDEWSEDHDIEDDSQEIENDEGNSYANGSSYY